MLLMTMINHYWYWYGFIWNPYRNETAKITDCYVQDLY